MQLAPVTDYTVVVCRNAGYSHTIHTLTCVTYSQRAKKSILPPDTSSLTTTYGSCAPHFEVIFGSPNTPLFPPSVLVRGFPQLLIDDPTLPSRIKEGLEPMRWLAELSGCLNIGGQYLLPAAAIAR